MWEHQNDLIVLSGCITSATVIHFSSCLSSICLFVYFKGVEREQVDSIQPKLQHVNAVGQGLIQSAAKHTDTQGLEHDLETTNLCWNSLNKRVGFTSVHLFFLLRV